MSDTIFGFVNAVGQFTPILVFIAVIYTISQIKVLQAWARAYGRSDPQTKWSLVENCPLGYVEITKTGKIRYVNAKMTEISGYSQAELITRNVNIILPEWSEKENYMVDDRSLLTHLLCKNKTKINVNIDLSNYAEQGQYYGSAWIKRRTENDNLKG